MDGEAILFHDSNAERVTGVNKNIHEMSSAEIRSLVVKQEINNVTYSSTSKVPFLSEILQNICQEDPERNFYVDVKSFSTNLVLDDQSEILGNLVVDLLYNSPCRGKSIVITTAHFLQARVIYDRMKELNVKYHLAMYLHPGTLPFGEHLWLRNRFLFWYSGTK